MEEGRWCEVRRREDKRVGRVKSQNLLVNGRSFPIKIVEAIYMNLKIQRLLRAPSRVGGGWAMFHFKLISKQHGYVVVLWPLMALSGPTLMENE